MKLKHNLVELKSAEMSALINQQQHFEYISNI